MENNILYWIIGILFLYAFGPILLRIIAFAFSFVFFIFCVYAIGAAALGLLFLVITGEMAKNNPVIDSKHIVYCTATIPCEGGIPYDSRSRIPAAHQPTIRCVEGTNCN